MNQVQRETERNVCTLKCRKIQRWRERHFYLQRFDIKIWFVKNYLVFIVLLTVHHSISA
jgi:hypothetical protein